MSAILPGAVIGIIGGGQLGRMFCMAARRMGYRTLVWTGGLEAPAMVVADEAIDLPFDSKQALAEFVSRADIATIEFENIPRATLEAVASEIPIHPSADAVAASVKRTSSAPTASLAPTLKSSKMLPNSPAPSNASAPPPC